MLEKMTIEGSLFASILCSLAGQRSAYVVTYLSYIRIRPSQCFVCIYVFLL